MNFLIVEIEKDNPEEEKITRSITVIDGGMSLKMLFITYRLDIIEALTGEAHSTGEFIAQIDEGCIIKNGEKVVDR